MEVKPLMVAVPWWNSRASVFCGAVAHSAQYLRGLQGCESAEVIVS